MQNRKRDTDVQNRLLGSVGEGKGGMFQEISIRNMYIIYGETDHQPRLDAWDRCTGNTQRDRVGREVGGGNGMGNKCKSMADSCQCMIKPTTIL